MKMTTGKIVDLYEVLSGAKLTKMDDADKFLVIKALRVLKPIADSFEAYKRDASERLKPEDFDSIVEKAQKWNELTEEERASINKSLIAYNNSVNKCIADELAAEVEVEYQKLSESAFEKLMASNDWEASKALLVADETVEL